MSSVFGILQNQCNIILGITGLLIYLNIVGNIPAKATECQLIDVFQTAGKVKSLKYISYIYRWYCCFDNLIFGHGTIQDNL